jgi:two-component system LytT family response regulator
MTHQIRTVLIDDEPPARERLVTLLSAHPQIEIVGEAWDLESARDVCARELPDLVLLDIHLPRASGFDLLPMLTGSPSVIFVTASDNHALKAFEVNALDYLLKPIHPDRLALSLSRVQARTTEIAGANLVALNEDRGLRLVPAQSISHIQAVDNYTNVHLLDGPPAFIRRSMTAWEQSLPAGQFLRLDRSLMVRLDAVTSLASESRDSSLLWLSGQEKPILLGRKAALLLRRAMKGS